MSEQAIHPMREATASCRNKIAVDGHGRAQALRWIGAAGVALGVLMTSSVLAPATAAESFLLISAP